MICLSADKVRMEKKTKEYGINIVKLMEKSNYMCILRANKNHPHLMKWIESMFCFFEYKGCTMLAPEMGYCDDEECDINYYDSAIMIEVNLNQEKNNVTFRKTTSLEFGIEKFMPVIYIKYDFVFDDEDDYRILDYVDNGAGIIKSHEKWLEMHKEVSKLK